MRYEVVVTDMVSAHAWVIAKTTDRRTALRWAGAQRDKLGSMSDVGVWCTSTDAWVYEDEDGQEVRAGH